VARIGPGPQGRGRHTTARQDEDHGDDGPGDAEQVAKRIRSALSTPFRLSDFETRIDCAIGVAFGSDTIGDSENIVRNAQFAVKRSKQALTSQRAVPLLRRRRKLLPVWPAPP
jgi:GGDEF domain-containing protein